MTSALAMEQIRQAYERGERRIEVAPDVFRAYIASLVANYRLSQELVYQRSGVPSHVWFKDARVMERSHVD